VVRSKDVLLSTFPGSNRRHVPLFHRDRSDRIARAFFNMSRSSFTLSSSFCSRSISSLGCFVWPLPGKALSLYRRYSRFHRCKMLGCMSCSLATSSTCRCSSRSDRTTSLLKSLGNFLRTCLMPTRHLYISCILLVRWVHCLGMSYCGHIRVWSVSLIQCFEFLRNITQGWTIIYIMNIYVPDDPFLVDYEHCPFRDTVGPEYSIFIRDLPMGPEVG